jgi:hypothetical protein
MAVRHTRVKLYCPKEGNATGRLNDVTALHVVRPCFMFTETYSVYCIYNIIAYLVDTARWVDITPIHYVGLVQKGSSSIFL